MPISDDGHDADEDDSEGEDICDDCGDDDQDDTEDDDDDDDDGGGGGGAAAAAAAAGAVAAATNCDSDDFVDDYDTSRCRMSVCLCWVCVSLRMYADSQCQC